MRTEPRFWQVAALLGLAGFAAGLGLCWWMDNNIVEFRVTMEVDKGNYVELFYNERYDEPKRLALVPGQIQDYRFMGLPSTVSMLRLDPTNARDAVIKIHMP